MDASRAAPIKDKKGPPSKADVALSYIRKLYAIEKTTRDLSDAECYQVRQEKSLPLLANFKVWLEANVSKVLKGSLTRKAMDYALNQWDTLVGYCERGDLNINNALGANASATCYSLVETATANQLEPSAYLHHLLTDIAEADTVEKLEALLPWNVELAASKKGAQYP